MSLRDWFNTPRTNVVSSILEFPAIDTDGMIKRMKLKERAREQGAHNLPSTDSRNWDVVEQDIINEIETEGKTQFSKYLEHQKTYADRAGDAALHGLIPRIQAVSMNAITDFERHTRVGRDDLYAHKREVIESERELKRFQKENRLNRPARNQGGKSLKWGLLVFLVAIESVLNGFFLSRGNVFGLVGGVSEAFVIAALNVAFGAIVGRFVIPWIIHISWLKRVLGCLGTTGYLLVTIGFNLAVAHYRQASVGDPFEASVLAYRTLLADPLGLPDLQAWTLFMIGMLFSLVAAYDGLNMDDPYPGYGQRKRHNLDALEDYNNLKDSLYQDLEEIKKNAEKEMDELVRTIQSHYREYEYIGLKSQALRSALQNHFGHLQNAGRTVLAFYRNENTKYRTTNAPQHFQDLWKYEHPVLEGTTVGDVNKQALYDEVERVMESIPQYQKALHDTYIEALSQYKQIDELVNIEEK